MRWKLERTTGVFALLLIIGCFLTTVRPMAAEPARLSAAAIAPAEAKAETAPAVTVHEAAQTAEEAAEPPAPVRFAVHFEGVEAGTALSLSGPDGARGTIEVPASGSLTLTLRPGAWGLAAPDGTSAGFTLRENAAIDSVTGDAWSDGESLVFTREVRGSVRVVRAAGCEVDTIYRLTGDGVDEQRAVAAAADAPRACTFWALPAGSYTLEENGAVAAYITITDSARNVTVELGE